MKLNIINIEFTDSDFAVKKETIANGEITNKGVIKYFKQNENGGTDPKPYFLKNENLNKPLITLENNVVKSAFIVLDIDKLEPGVTFRSAVFTELEKIKNNIDIFLQHKDV